MTSTQDVSAPTDAEFSEFLNSLLNEGNDTSSTDVNGDWLDALLADCADSINDGPIGQDHIATPERDKTGGHNHKIHIHHRETGKHVGSFNFSA